MCNRGRLWPELELKCSWDCARNNRTDFCNQLLPKQRWRSSWCSIRSKTTLVILIKLSKWWHFVPRCNGKSSLTEEKRKKISSAEATLEWGWLPSGNKVLASLIMPLNTVIFFKMGFGEPVGMPNELNVSTSSLVTKQSLTCGSASRVYCSNKCRKHYGVDESAHLCCKPVS